MARQKRIGLTGDEEFCLCGYLATGDSSTAYRLAMKSTSEDTLNLQKMASRWLNRSECQEFIEARRAADYKAAKESITNEEGKTGNLTRSDAEAILNAVISSTSDPKIKADAIMKLADFNRWKKTEDTSEDKNVVFYIPLQIDRCRELFAYRLKQAFGWTDEEQGKAVRIMENAMSNEPIEDG